MATNIAARRAAKANRRKAVVAEKRKAGLGANSLAARVAAATDAPIRHCLLNEHWRETGMGTVLLVRGVTGAHLTMGMFLIDAFCLGVKDVGFRVIDTDTLQSFLDITDESSPLSPVDPAYARKLLRELVAWSASIGFTPHRDFATVERLFGAVDPDACTAEFEFGHNGKPLYIRGPMDTPAQVRQRLAQVSSATGGTGPLNFIVGDKGDEDAVRSEIAAE